MDSDSESDMEEDERDLHVAILKNFLQRTKADDVYDLTPERTVADHNSNSFMISDNTISFKDSSSNKATILSSTKK